MPHEYSNFVLVPGYDHTYDMYVTEEVKVVYNRKMRSYREYYEQDELGPNEMVVTAKVAMYGMA